MSEYLGTQEHTDTVGSFNVDKHRDFKNGVKALMESFEGQFQADAMGDISKILKIDSLKESYKNALIGDVLAENFDDAYYAMLPDKMEQLFENSAMEILIEASSVGQLAPIVGYSLPILKKNFLECHGKDIVMTEVPSKPIVKVAFERKFLKDKDGNKYYIPEVFYSEQYKDVLAKCLGKTVSNKYYPETGTLPIQDFGILAASGGTIQTRDSLAYDFCIEAVKMEVPKAATPAEKEIIEITGLCIQPDFATNSFTYRVKYTVATTPTPTVVEDIITGQIDSYAGTISVASTGGKIKNVRFGGHLSNENNLETVELDRERTTKQWMIPDGQRINTGLTVEKIKDYKALFDIDVTTDTIADMSTVLTQFEDSTIMTFMDDSMARFKNKYDLPFGYQDKFVESAEFSCTPPSNIMVTPSQWVDTELKYFLNRFVDRLKVKLRTTDIMFVVYGHPNNISFIQDNVKWIIDEDTKIGGVQLDYRFGVMTANKNRIHVVSSMKTDASKGLRVVAYPLSKEVITFKHYKYSLNIENTYRNSLTPLVPNVMGVSRYLTTEVLPVQGEFLLTNNAFGLK